MENSANPYHFGNHYSRVFAINRLPLKPKSHIVALWGCLRCGSRRRDEDALAASSSRRCEPALRAWQSHNTVIKAKRPTSGLLDMLALRQPTKRRGRVSGLIFSSLRARIAGVVSHHTVIKAKRPASGLLDMLALRQLLSLFSEEGCRSAKFGTITVHRQHLLAVG